jgi:uncharacterized membrane protein YphA (DoxX/SURF4 family)
MKNGMRLLKREFQISGLAVVILVLLRIAIGWHFLHEGLWKHAEADFSAEPYLRQARGPLANLYRRLVPDYFGEERLSAAATRERWTKIATEAADHFGFSAAQRKQAQQMLAQRLKEYDETLLEDKKIEEADESGAAEAAPAKRKAEKVVKEQIRWYQQGLERWKEDEARPETQDVPFKRKRHWDELVKLQQDVQPFLTEVDRMEKGLRSDLAWLATAQQRQAAGPLPEQRTWLDLLEVLTTYSLIAIGFCLMIGLATRLAALGGAVFLLTAVVLPQLSWPTVYPPPPPSAGHAFLVNKEVIEMLVLVFLSVTAVGRWAGLDYIGHALFTRYYGAAGNFIQRHLGNLVLHALAILARLRKDRVRDEKDEENRDDENRENDPKEKEKSDASS